MRGARRRTEFFEPIRPGSLAADRGVFAVSDAGETFDDRFDARPELEPLEDGIHEIGDGAIVRVLRVGVMEPVVMRCLQDAPILQRGDQPAVFCAGAVRPFVDLVGVDAERDEEPQLPRHHAERPRAD